MDITLIAVFESLMKLCIYSIQLSAMYVYYYGCGYLSLDGIIFYCTNSYMTKVVSIMQYCGIPGRFNVLKSMEIKAITASNVYGCPFIILHLHFFRLKLTQGMLKKSPRKEPAYYHVSLKPNEFIPRSLICNRSKAI